MDAEDISESVILADTARPMKKPPRKPRPSEIAAKKAREKLKKKAKAAKFKKAVRKKKVVKKPTRPKKKVKRKPKSRPVVVTHRLDIRMTKAQRTKIETKAKKLRRTITSLVLEAIEKIK